MGQLKKIVLINVLFALFFLLLQSAMAETVTVTSRGIGGDRDKKAREPELSVTRIVEGDKVKLLVDAHVPNNSYQHYPLRFDFFVNRRLFSSQIRSQTLPGPVGVTIGPDTASLPFNYSVLAQVQHPNRSFTTIIEGAAFAANLADTLDCLLTIAEGAGTEEYEDSAAQTTQETNSSMALTFNGEDELGRPAALTGLLRLDGPAAAATLSLLKNGSSRMIDTSGTIRLGAGDFQIAELELSSADGLLKLNCEGSAAD